VKTFDVVDCTVRIALGGRIVAFARRDGVDHLDVRDPNRGSIEFAMQVGQAGGRKRQPRINPVQHQVAIDLELLFNLVDGGEVDNVDADRDCDRLPALQWRGLQLLGGPAGWRATEQHEGGEQ
jgi:hypothetical protein